MTETSALRHGAFVANVHNRLDVASTGRMGPSKCSPCRRYCQATRSATCSSASTAPLADPGGARPVLGAAKSRRAIHESLACDPTCSASTKYHRRRVLDQRGGRSISSLIENANARAPAGRAVPEIYTPATRGNGEGEVRSLGTYPPHGLVESDARHSAKNR